MWFYRRFLSFLHNYMVYWIIFYSNTYYNIANICLQRTLNNACHLGRNIKILWERFHIFHLIRGGFCSFPLIKPKIRAIYNIKQARSYFIPSGFAFTPSPHHHNGIIYAKESDLISYTSTRKRWERNLSETRKYLQNLIPRSHIKSPLNPKNSFLGRFWPNLRL